jgi:hypothetical protein
LDQELSDAVSKLNSYFGGDKGQGSVALNQDDVGSIGLGMPYFFYTYSSMLAEISNVITC